MKYDHLVKYNGIFYEAGMEVPDGASEEPEKDSDKKTEATKGHLDLEELKTYEEQALRDLATKLGVEFSNETTHDELAELVSKVEVELPATNEKQYKKSDISNMNVEGLKKLAAEFGIEGAEDSTGVKLKEEIIAKLGL